MSKHLKGVDALIFEFSSGEVTEMKVPVGSRLAMRVSCDFRMDHASSLTGFQIPERVNGRRLKRLTQIINETKKCFQADLPCVILSQDALKFQSDVEFHVIRPLIRAAAGRFNPVFFPERLSNTRRVCRHIYSIASSHPNVICMGAGFQDFYVNEDTGQTQVDIDEFTYRLDWIFDFCNKRRIKIVYILCPPQGRTLKKKNRLVYCEKTALPYVDAFLSLAKKRYDVLIFDARQFGKAVTEGQKNVKKRLVKELAEVLAAAARRNESSRGGKIPVRG